MLICVNRRRKLVSENLSLQFSGIVLRTYKQKISKPRANGDIEITATELKTLMPLKSHPPFTIEDDSDVGDELRMK
jgi:aspartyl-tRNA synthetase